MQIINQNAMFCDNETVPKKMFDDTYISFNKNVTMKEFKPHRYVNKSIDISRTFEISPSRTDKETSSIGKSNFMIN